MVIFLGAIFRGGKFHRGQLSLVAIFCGVGGGGVWQFSLNPHGRNAFKLLHIAFTLLNNHQKLCFVTTQISRFLVLIAVFTLSQEGYKLLTSPFIYQYKNSKNVLAE